MIRQLYVIVGLLAVSVGCRSTRLASSPPAVSGLQSPSDPVCGPPGTRSGSPTRVLRHDDPRHARTAVSQVVGRVVDVDGVPLTDAQLSLRPEDGPDSRRLGTRSDSLGQFALSASPPGWYRLRVHRLGFLQQEHQLRLAAGIPDTLCLRLRAMPVELAPTVPLPLRGEQP